MKKALLIIDLQNDYFEGGAFQLWNTEKTLENIEAAIDLAHENDVAIIHVQHVADPELGLAPFFNKGTEGVKIHPRILAKAPEGKVVVKTFADGFYKTDLEKVLSEIGAEEILVCGMMTQNCVTHTAISRAAEKYKVSILADCCTSTNELIHLIGLGAVMSREEIAIVPYAEALV
ncbi:MAG: cysteine hydrolase family protein [Sarcina sp.]